ncbi:class I tRNA ligase family protein, partial [Vibrio parahaemolyticus]
MSDADRWILYKLGELERDIDSALKTYRFSDAANGLYSFIWNSFCDWYL